MRFRCGVFLFVVESGNYYRFLSVARRMLDMGLDARRIFFGGFWD